MSFGKCSQKLIAQIKDKTFDVLALKLMKSPLKTVKIEDKGRGLLILVSTALAEDLSKLTSFKILRESFEEVYIELVGLDIRLRLEKVTQLHLPKKLFFIEEMEDDRFRLTFSTALIEKIRKIDEISIKSI